MASSQTLSHPPAEGLRTRSDEGWGWFCVLPAEPAQLPAAPLAAGVAVFLGTPRDRLLGNRRCHARLFLQADQGGPVPQATECGPSPAPCPPRPRFSEGTDSRPSRFLPAPGPLWSCPRNAGCRRPGPREEGHQGPVFQTGRWNVLSRRSRHPRPRLAAAAFLV